MEMGMARAAALYGNARASRALLLRGRFCTLRRPSVIARLPPFFSGFLEQVSKAVLERSGCGRSNNWVAFVDVFIVAGI